MLSPDRGGIHRPASEEEVVALVQWARARGTTLRVRGSGHSVPPAYTSDGIDVCLDRLDALRFDDARRQVRVGAGRRLGADPRDRSGRATVQAGLCWQLEQRGWALPVTAGVTHQTVAGFLMTGSAGGSRRFALADAVVALRVVDAAGEIHEITGERLDAAVVSLGLLGIVTEVTLQCEERFDVAGYEQIVRAAEFGDVDAFLTAHDYARIFWWPQRGVEKFSVWAADRTAGPGERVPYDLLPRVAGSTVPAQAIAGTVIARSCRRRSWGRARAAIYNAFMPAGEPARFRDAWWRVIPMDDELDERFFDSTWSELWFPAEVTTELLRRLREHFAAGGFAATGGYTFELYAAPASRHWLSPAYRRDSVRLNICWMEGTPGDPREVFLPQFWALLEDLDFRLHWGKHLPLNGGAGRRHPRLDDFLDLRHRMDPDGLFLTDYWRAQLGLGGVTATRSTPPPTTPAPGPPPGRWRWPLIFKLRPSDAGFADRAPYVIDEHAVLAAPAEQIYDAIVDLAGAREWLADFVRAEWVSGPDADGNQVVDEIFRFMSERVRTFHAERGVRWMASVESCTLPLAREMMQDLQLSTLPDGRTQLRWRFFYEPYGALGPLRGLLHRFFAKMIRADIASLDEYLAGR